MADIRQKSRSVVGNATAMVYKIFRAYLPEISFSYRSITAL
ncbi:hypothetical protein [Lacrimispora brassicae]